MTISDHLVDFGLSTVLLIDCDHLGACWALCSNFVIVEQLGPSRLLDMAVEEAIEVQDALLKDSVDVHRFELLLG